MNNSLQYIIQEGTKCWAKTRHSNMRLLCTVIMLDNCNVKVELPCTINGFKTDVVNLKDIQVLPPEPRITLPKWKEKDRPENNPFRKIIDNLKCIEDEKQNNSIQNKPAKQTEAISTIDESLIDMSSLTEYERKAYKELFK